MVDCLSTDCKDLNRNRLNSHQTRNPEHFKDVKKPLEHSVVTEMVIFDGDVYGSYISWGIITFHKHHNSKVYSLDRCLITF